ncbi:unnamed protein product [Eruca vesicaria subsp. sativa]|uniref:glutamate decarboxylase n=1 Tax=Eruca vesicaria subsp. sativa TaxID=29727 RepID=A0ABC8M372_ERUVS|nr:unnamed protein product [Eruca vesicaria subsp. sativa]
MDPEQAVEMVDENTICVAAILGSTLNGEFEDVKLLNDLLIGYTDPCGCSKWRIHSTYGLVYAGIGWVVWRNKEDLPDELIFHINYLGADQPTFTLNFSKSSSQVIAQYYQLIRLGHEGYRNVMEQGVVLATTKTKPKISVNKSILKKEFPTMSKAVANQVSVVDLKVDQHVKFPVHRNNKSKQNFKRKIKMKKSPTSVSPAGLLENNDSPGRMEHPHMYP